MNTYRVLVADGYETVKADMASIEHGALAFWKAGMPRHMVAAYAPDRWSLVTCDGADVTKPVQQVA